MHPKNKPRYDRPLDRFAGSDKPSMPPRADVGDLDGDSTGRGNETGLSRSAPLSGSGRTAPPPTLFPVSGCASVSGPPYLAGCGYDI